MLEPRDWDIKRGVATPAKATGATNPKNFRKKKGSRKEENSFIIEEFSQKGKGVRGMHGP